MRIVLACCLMLCALHVTAQNKPTSIIYVIGDGMGMEYLTAYRHFQDDPTTAALESTWFDRYLVGTASTHPDDVTQVTDSAASATALAAGIKTYNGAIGVDSQGQKVETLLERAKKRGYQTAMVATSQINHATPASFAAHIDSRQKYDEIADQYLERRYQGKPWVDILLGGGKQYFERDDRHLVDEFKALGYQYAGDFAGLDTLTRAPALALLADRGLPFAIDEPPADRLRVLTRKALELLEADKPFFLLVEASQIDWCGHANDIACAMREMADAEAALQAIEDYVGQHPQTLVVVTADHSTGGLTMGAEGEYVWRAEVVRGIKASANTLAAALVAQKPWYATWQSLTGIELTNETKERFSRRLDEVHSAETEAVKNTAITALRAQVLAQIDRASATGWTTSGHTGGDVAVMALGAGAQAFAGQQDNTELARKLFAVIGE